jgi:hypothetical protein
MIDAERNGGLMRVEVDVEVLMLHVVSRKGGLITSETTTFRIQSALVRRPDLVARFGHLRCLTCGTPVRLRIHNVVDTQRRRRRGVVVAVVGGLLLTAAVSAIVIFGDRYAGVASVSGATIAVALTAIYVGALSIVRENGVVILARDADRRHSVVPPYLTGGWRRRDRRTAAPTSFVYED